MIETQFTDMEKVRYLRAPENQDRKEGMSIEGNFRKKTVRKSRNHALAKKQAENLKGGDRTPKRKLENQEGTYYSPAKRLNLNMELEANHENWTYRTNFKPSVTIFENSDNEGLGQPASHATPKGKPENK